jgi:hypothetical protein
MVNTDGSLNCSSREAGSGYVIRNYLGEFVEAGCRKYPHIDDPFISELLASRDGLEAAARLGISKLSYKRTVARWPNFGRMKDKQEVKVLTFWVR